MEYIVSARKYRPMSFDSVVGQSALTTTLKNAVKSGKLAHAYLFCGPRGVGKTTCARIFAKAINCLTPTEDGEACNHCESCQAFNEQRSYNIFELDAASNNSVENIKALMEQTRIPPQVGKYKVFIIDEVHMLSSSAFNAFLKTLEEPPAHVIFILATTEKHKILPTIISRCQIYDFERMTVQDTIEHLKMVAQKENIQYEDEALAVIAEKADGGMRDALSIFDQAASFCQGNITYQKVIEDLNVLDTDNYFSIIDLALENKVSDIMVLLNQLIGRGFDGGNLVLGLASHVRNVLMAKDSQTLPLLEVSQQQRERYQQQAQRCPVKFLYQALKIMNQCDINYRQSNNKRLLVELTLIQVAQITQKDDDGAGAGRSPKRLKSLFHKLMNVRQNGALQVAQSEQKSTSQTLPKASEPAENRPSMATSDVRQSSVSSGRAGALLSRLTFSFANIRGDAEQQVSQVEEKIENKEENAAFSEEELMVAWRAMCIRMQGKDKTRGLASRLKNMTPHIVGFPVIELVCDNEMLMEEVSQIKGRIRATMAKELHNGQIDFRIRLADREEIKPVLTKPEVLRLLRKSNPAIDKLAATLDFEVT
ncbi:MAG: DNA polymerase III subunit gamma/tau [Prevotella sp.]|nr:DNA polymerase III subunit gamma/tau [Prevotella sp.]